MLVVASVAAGFENRDEAFRVVGFARSALPALKAPPTSFCENTWNLPLGSRTYIRSSLQ